MRKFFTVLILMFLSACGKEGDPTHGFMDMDVKFNRNIVGGTSAREAEYSGVFALKFCSAVMISQRLILTAAHCIHGSNFSFSSQKVYLSNDTSNIKFKTLKYREIYVHRDFKQKLMADLAIVELESDISESFDVVAIPIAQFKAEELKNALISDKKLVAVGYGDAKAGRGVSGFLNGSQYSKKRKVELDLLRFLKDFYDAKSKSWVLRLIDGEELEKTYPDTFALSAKSKDTCQGDSGGPIYIESRDGELLLFGVTLRGAVRCGSDKIPSYYRLLGKELCVFENILNRHGVNLSLCGVGEIEANRMGDEDIKDFPIVIETLDQYRNLRP